MKDLDPTQVQVNDVEGQKAGSKSASQPTIAPDSASSKTIMKQVIGLSEGEIESFSAEDVFLNDTSIADLAEDIKYEFRFGSLNQPHVDGLDEVASEVLVNVQVRNDMPWIKAISNSDLDSVGVMITFAPLKQQLSNGNVVGVRVDYQILVAKNNGSTFEVAVNGSVNDKTSDNYSRYHELVLPESENGWLIRVVRTTPDSTSDLISDKMYVASYSEIIKSKFTYPYTAYLYLEYDAQMFSSIPKVSVLAKGIKIQVPSNYDAEARTYSGLWDGTFKISYTNNPAWVYYALCTNERFGLGDKIKSNMIDKWALYKIAQFCDQMVDDGFGGLEPRMTCNVYLQTKERAYDILNRLSGIFRGMSFWSGTQIVAEADIPQDSIYLFTNANIVDGLFEYSSASADDCYSAAKVAWDNPNNKYETEYEPIAYEHLIHKYGFKLLELDAWGCTSKGQALRAGRWALLDEIETITFKVGLDGRIPLPGKVIDVQDELRAGASLGGRIQSISADRKTIVLDKSINDKVQINVGDDFIVNNDKGQCSSRKINSVNGLSVTLATAFNAGEISEESIWVVNSSNLQTVQYRVLSVKQDDPSTFTISAKLYDSNKFDEIEKGIVFDEPITSIINPGALKSVQNITITAADILYQGLTQVNLDINWERSEYAVKYIVEFNKDSSGWIRLPDTGNNSVTLENVYAGNYQVRITAVSAFGVLSKVSYSTLTTIKAKQSNPNPPLNLRTTSQLLAVQVDWNFGEGSEDLSHVQLAVSRIDPSSFIGNDEDYYTVFKFYDKAYPDTSMTFDGMGIGDKLWVKAKSVDKLGLSSTWTTWVSGQPNVDPDQIMDVISGHIGIEAIDAELAKDLEDTNTLATAAQQLAQQAKQDAQTAKDEARDAINELITDVNASDAAIRESVNQVKNEAQNAVNEVTQNLGIEISARQRQAQQMQNGITSAQQTADGAVSELNNFKSSTAQSLANVQTSISSVATDTAANTNKINQLDSSLQGTSQVAATALEKANTATSATNSLAEQTTALRANIGAAVLSAIPQGEQPNKFTALIVPRGEVGAQQIPSYEHLTNTTPIVYSYFTQDMLLQSFALDNIIGFFRTIVVVSEARTIVLNDFVGDDAHAIYVDGKLYYSNPYHNGANPSTISINLTAGTHILDFAFNNGNGGWGIKFSNSLAGQLNEMYAATIDYIDKANSSYVNDVKATADLANGNASSALTKIESLTTTVGNNSTQINNLAQTKADSSTLIATVQQGLQSTWQNDAANAVNNLDIGGRNLFPVTLASNGYFSGTTGSIITANLSHKAYNVKIPVGKSKNIIYQVWNPDLVVNNGYTNRVVFFDANNTLVKYYDIPKLNGTPYQSLLMDVPTNASSFSLGAIVGVESATDVSPNIKVKFEFGNKGTDWTPAPEDVTSNATAAAASAVASLQIGGRNLAKGTANAITSSNNTGTNRLTVLYYMVFSWLALYNKGYTKLCVSFDWKYVGSNPSGTFRLQQNASPYASLASTITVSSANSSGRVSGSLMTPASNWSDVTSLAIRRDNMDGAIEISNFKIEIGTKTTDWTPAPEDIVADLATYKATADQTYQTKTDANQANATFAQQLATKAESADLIATKADIQNNYATKSNLNESVATASQSLTSSFQSADQIIANNAAQDATNKANDAKAAAAQDASDKANAAIQTALQDATNKANNAINVAAQDATAKANNATTQANAYTRDYAFSKTETNNAISGSLQTYDASVTIGGNNLYRGSQDWSSELWNNKSPYEAVAEEYKGLKVLRSYANWSGINQSQYFDLGVSYTLSAWIRKSDANVPIHFWGDYLAGDAGAGTQKPMEPNVWTRVTHTFKGNGQIGNGRFERVANDAGGYYEICGLKLERGSKATDWSPNPNDAINSLTLGGRNLFNRNVVYQELAGAQVVTKVADGFDVMGVGENNAVLRLYNIHIPVGDCVISFDHFIGTAPFTLSINADDGAVTLFTAKGGWNHYEIVIKNTVDRSDGWLDINGLTGQLHQFRNFMVEKGNKASAYRPAPEDTDYAIQQVQANLVNFQQAQATADQAQTQRLDEAFSQIGGNSSRITNVEQTKADTSQVSSIVRNDLSSEWNAAANNAANSAVNALQIGGTNLLPNTEKLKGWGFSGSASIANDLTFGDFVITKAISPFHYSFLDMALVEGQTYTLSGWIRSTQAIYVGFFGYSSGGQGHQLTVPSQWKRWTHTFVAPNSNVIRIRLESGESTDSNPLYVCGMKLELGNKATDWSPAPSDVIALINWQIVNEPTDLNNLTTTGKYLLKNISANSPVSAWAYVEVDAAQPDRITQTIWKDSDINVKLERSKFDTVWSDWIKRATAIDVNNLKSEVSQTYQTKSDAQQTTATLTQSINSKTSPQDVNNLLSTKVDAKDITYRVNLNDMRTVGLYLLRGGWDNGAYSPDGVAWHWLDVKGGIVDGRVQQTMWPDNSTGTVTNRAYNGAWSEWNTVANTQQINGLRSEVQNTYSTKTDTTNAIAQGINAYKVSQGSVLSYKISSVGNGNSGYAGIRNVKDEAMYDTPRSYAFAIFNNGNLVYWSGYDVYANAGGADSLAASINNMASNEYGVVITSDEPRDGRNENLKNALVSIGGTRAAFDALQYRGAYILVGRKGLQEGGGLELLSNGAQIEFMLQFINGVPVGVGGNSSIAKQVANDASVITQTQAQVGSLQNGLSTLSQQTTTLTSTVNTLGATSANLLKNSDFSAGLDNWSFWSNIGGGTGIRNPPDDWAVVADESRTAELHIGGNSDQGGYACVAQTVPVVGGKWYQFSAFTGVHRSSRHIYNIWWNDVNGNRIANSSKDITMWAGGKKLSDYYNGYFNTQAPANAVSASFELGCGGGSDVYMFMTRASICQVANEQAALVPWSPSSAGVNSQLKTQTATIQQQAQTIDGINASYTVKISNNGYGTGFGLISTGSNGAPTSAFMVDSDAFVVGKAGVNIKPIVAVSAGQTIDGVYYAESGTYLNTAWIAKATIKTAYLMDASITTAKIADAAIDSAKIKDLAVSTLKIQDNAVTVPSGVYTGTKQQWEFVAYSPAVNAIVGSKLVQEFNVQTNGGKLRVDATFNYATGIEVGVIASNLDVRKSVTLVAQLLINNIVVYEQEVYPTTIGRHNLAIEYTGAMATPVYIHPATTGTINIKLNVGAKAKYANISFGTNGSYDYYMTALTASIATMELKK